MTMSDSTLATDDLDALIAQSTAVANGPAKGKGKGKRNPYVEWLVEIGRAHV